MSKCSDLDERRLRAMEKALHALTVRVERLERRQQPVNAVSPYDLSRGVTPRVIRRG